MPKIRYHYPKSPAGTRPVGTAWKPYAGITRQITACFHKTYRLMSAAFNWKDFNPAAIDLHRVKWFTDHMTATWEQMQSELPRLLDLVQRGEEVVITKHGRVVAKLTGVAATQPVPRDRRAWLAKLAHLRESTATGKTSPSTEDILDDLRSERG